MSDIIDQLREASLAFPQDWRLLRDAAAEIARLRDERRWIPVEERLPAVDEYVLGCGEELDRGSTPEITHWQPLQPPPGEGEVGE